MSSDQLISNEFPLAGYTILLVEDDTDMRELLSDLLRLQSGANVITATSASEALRLTQQKPDLLISNILLPDADGYTLLQQLRSLNPEPQAQIPAIAITALANDANHTQLVESGFQAYFFKPFTIDELILKINELLQLNQTD